MIDLIILLQFFITLRKLFNFISIFLAEKKKKRNKKKSTGI